MTYHLRAFLGADDATLTRALTDGGPIEAVLGAIPGRLSGPARTALAAEITAAAGGLLEDDLGSVLLSALMGHHGLVAAARETAAEPDVTRLVTLDDHVIRATDEPHVDVLVDHARVYVVRLVLTVALTVRGTRRCCSGSAWGSRCRRPSSRIRPAASPASPSPGSERRDGDGRLVAAPPPATEAGFRVGRERL